MPIIMLQVIADMGRGARSRTAGARRAQNAPKTLQLDPKYDTELIAVMTKAAYSTCKPSVMTT